jgi:hypothetical protein
LSFSWRLTAASVAWEPGVSCTGVDGEGVCQEAGQGGNGWLSQGVWEVLMDRQHGGVEACSGG